MWFVYTLLTAACALGYYMAGMDAFDAVAHSFSTLSTGGFSPYDANLGHFHSASIDAVATVFMFVGGASFALHFTALRQRNPWLYWQETEFKAYFWMLAAISVGTAVYLRTQGTFDTLGDALRYASLHVVSMQTSSGFTDTGFAHWPGALPALLMMLTLVGGCAGSTAGGMKVMRWLLVTRQGVVELKRLVHPSAEIPVKLAGRAVPQRVIIGVAGFFAMYFIIFAILTLLLMMFGLDQVTAWSAIASSINNTGPGLGAVAQTFSGIPDAAKWVCTVAMLVGRLEVFTLVLLLTPAFWRR